jgi:hypothetical protein
MLMSSRDENLTNWPARLWVLWRTNTSARACVLTGRCGSDSAVYSHCAGCRVTPAAETTITTSWARSSAAMSSSRWAPRTAIASGCSQSSRTWRPIVFLIRRRVNSRSWVTSTAPGHRHRPRRHRHRRRQPARRWTASSHVQLAEAPRRPGRRRRGPRRSALGNVSVPTCRLDVRLGQLREGLEDLLDRQPAF